MLLLGLCFRSEKHELVRGLVLSLETQTHHHSNCIWKSCESWKGKEKTNERSTLISFSQTSKNQQPAEARDESQGQASWEAELLKWSWAEQVSSLSSSFLTPEEHPGNPLWAWDSFPVSPFLRRVLASGRTEMLSTFCSTAKRREMVNEQRKKQLKFRMFFSQQTQALCDAFFISWNTSLHYINYLFSEFVNVSSGFFFHLSHKIVSDTQFFLSFLILWLVLWVMWYLHLININMWWVWISK